MEEKSSEVTFKFYLPEHQTDVFLHINAKEMYSCLWEIYQKCREQMKYGDNEAVIDFAEKINEIVWQINLDQVQ